MDHRTSDTLFALLRAALHDVRPEPIAGRIDWSAVFAAAQRQGVAALAWEGLQRLQAAGECVPPMDRETKLRWFVSVEAVKQRYRKQQRAARHLGELLSEAGLSALVFKGLSLSGYYPEPECRECGDIDLIAFDGRCRELERCIAAAGGRAGHVSPKHATLTFQGVPIESHRFFVWDFLSRSDRELNRELMRSMRDAKPLSGGKGLQQPAVSFDELFVPVHAATHFRTEGIVVRHLIDWMLVVGRAGGRPDMERLARYGLDGFVRILDRIARERLGADISEEFCCCDDAVCAKVLDDMLSCNEGNSGSSGSKYSLLRRKFRRFTSRRWTYPLTGASFARSAVRSAAAHLIEPGALFRGKR